MPTAGAQPPRVHRGGRRLCARIPGDERPSDKRPHGEHQSGERPSGRRDRWSPRGDGPVDFAILALPTLLLAFMIVQAGFVWYADSVALAAATQGANTARGYQSTAAAGTAKANQFLTSVGPVVTSPRVTTRAAGNEMICQVDGTAPSIFPWLTFHVSQSARGPIERFVP
jgi:hypothetical protein